MASEEIGVGPPEATSVAPEDGRGHGRYKSWRKKFRKMKRVFDEKMKESNDLVKDEHKLRDIARRLGEQNDMILDILLDQNNSPQIPPDLRYDLLDEQDHADTSAIEAELNDGKDKLANYEIEPHEFVSLQQSLSKRALRTGTTRFSSLLSVPHTHHLPPSELQRLGISFDNNNEANPPGFIPIERLETLARDLDVALHQPNEPDPHFPPLVPQVRGETVHEGEDNNEARDRFMGEKGLALENPVSVYNYLRRHHQHIFLQDPEIVAEKAARKELRAEKGGAAGASGKRKRAREDADMDDELYAIGPEIESLSNGRGKRQKEDDAAYRPKGGSSRAKAKRKREDGENGSRKKVARGSGISAAPDG